MRQCRCGVGARNEENEAKAALLVAAECPWGVGVRNDDSETSIAEDEPKEDAGPGHLFTGVHGIHGCFTIYVQYNDKEGESQAKGGVSVTL